MLLVFTLHCSSNAFFVWSVMKSQVQFEQFQILKRTLAAMEETKRRRSSKHCQNGAHCKYLSRGRCLFTHTKAELKKAKELKTNAYLGKLREVIILKKSILRKSFTNGGRGSSGFHTSIFFIVNGPKYSPPKKINFHKTPTPSRFYETFSQNRFFFN